MNSWICIGLAAVVASGTAEAKSGGRPNLLVFITDDQSWAECSAYGPVSVPTPHFDRVARDGVLFRHGYASAPSCAPSRAALLTGRNFWELEQGAFIQAWLPAKFPVLPEILGAAGYHTGYTGKGWGPGVSEMSGRDADPAGRQYSKIRFKKPGDGLNPVDYASNFKAFLDERPADAPFYFWIGTTEPHHPHGWDNHTKLGVDLEDIRVPAFLPDTRGVRINRANYLYEVRYADDVLGKALKILEDLGELENTLIVVTSDNGTPTPRAKATVYDWGVRMPFAAMWPARAPAGRTVEDFVNLIDIAPTFLEAAGVPAPAGMSGRSFLNVLTSSATGLVDSSRVSTASGLEWHGRTFARRMIRDARHMYIVNYTNAPPPWTEGATPKPDSEFPRSAQTRDVPGLIADHPDHPVIRPFVLLHAVPPPPEELFDCVADPFQMTNLVDRADLDPVLDRMRRSLRDYQIKTGDPRATGDMALFERTRAFIDERKRNDYKGDLPAFPD